MLSIKHSPWRLKEQQLRPCCPREPRTCLLRARRSAQVSLLRLPLGTITAQTRGLTEISLLTVPWRLQVQAHGVSGKSGSPVSVGQISPGGWKSRLTVSAGQISPGRLKSRLMVSAGSQARGVSGADFSWRLESGPTVSVGQISPEASLLGLQMATSSSLLPPWGLPSVHPWRASVCLNFLALV